VSSARWELRGGRLQGRFLPRSAGDGAIGKAGGGSRTQVIFESTWDILDLAG